MTEARTFQLSRNSVLRTTFVDVTTGHVEYHIDTPMKFTGSVTRIRKFDLPPQPPVVWDDKASSDFDDDSTDGGEGSGPPDPGTGVEDLPKTDDEIARIHWKWFSPNMVDFQGKLFNWKEFLPKCGRMKRSFKFTAPDGVEYRWAMGSSGTKCPRLVTMDEKKTVIARYHPSRHFSKKRKPRLEVQPTGTNMLDHVVLTFVLAEQKRRERDGAKK